MGAGIGTMPAGPGSGGGGLAEANGASAPSVAAASIRTPSARAKRRAEDRENMVTFLGLGRMAAVVADMAARQV